MFQPLANMNSTGIMKHYKSSPRRNSAASTRGKQSESSPAGNWITVSTVMGSVFCYPCDMTWFRTLKSLQVPIYRPPSLTYKQCWEHLHFPGASALVPDSVSPTSEFIDFIPVGDSEENCFHWGAKDKMEVLSLQGTNINNGRPSSML